jgi:hypothetical protein
MVFNYAALPKNKRLEAAVQACQQNKALSAYRAGKIYECGAPSTITRYLRGVTKSRKAVATTQQILAPIGKETIIKWALQYHSWGLPISIQKLR